MNTQINDGGPAFPHFKTNSATGYVELCPQGGMTLRDYFAGQALSGMLAHLLKSTPSAFASNAYEIADAMLAAHKEASK